MPKRIAFAVTGLFLLGGCTTYAGPFVTNIRPNGDGSLLLKKCMLKFIPSGEAVVPDQLTNARCTSRTIDLKTGNPGNGPNP